MAALGDGEIEREARRVFRRLCAPGAHLRRDGEDWRIGGRDASRKTRIGAAAIGAWQQRGWLSAAGDHFVLSDAGFGWFTRGVAQDNPFAAQHQALVTRVVTDAQGREQRVLVNDHESPLARLKHRKAIDGVQFDAGERLRRDFTLAGLMPRLGVDLSQPLVTGTRGQKAQAELSETVLAAKQRFAAAMRAAGPGLSDLLFDVCCLLRGLEDAERAKGWPTRSAKVVLTIGLDRLADHYGMRVRGRARLRGWQMEETL